MEKPKHISIRIEADTLRKFHFVSKYYARSASGHIMYLILKCIRDFESQHGEIILDPSEDN